MMRNLGISTVADAHRYAASIRVPTCPWSLLLPIAAVWAAVVALHVWVLP